MFRVLHLILQASLTRRHGQKCQVLTLGMLLHHRSHIQVVRDHLQIILLLVVTLRFLHQKNRPVKTTAVVEKLVLQGANVILPVKIMVIAVRMSMITASLIYTLDPPRPCTMHVKK
jgi:hypothetical protein